MSHTYRAANVLGALSLAVAERIERAAESASLPGPSAPAALVALDTFMGGETIDSLRRVLGLTHSGTVRLVDRLAAEGLVERGAGPDARSVALNLTPAGQAAAAAVGAARAAALEEVLGVLDPPQRVAIAPLLSTLLEGVTGGRADARHICRLCDADGCGHHEGLCPVTRAADRAERSKALLEG